MKASRTTRSIVAGFFQSSRRFLRVLRESVVRISAQKNRTSLGEVRLDRSISQTSPRLGRGVAGEFGGSFGARGSGAALATTGVAGTGTRAAALLNTAAGALGLADFAASQLLAFAAAGSGSLTPARISRGGAATSGCTAAWFRAARGWRAAGCRLAAGYRAALGLALLLEQSGGSLVLIHQGKPGCHHHDGSRPCHKASHVHILL